EDGDEKPHVRGRGRADRTQQRREGHAQHQGADAGEEPEHRARLIARDRDERHDPQRQESRRSAALGAQESERAGKGAEVVGDALERWRRLRHVTSPEPPPTLGAVGPAYASGQHKARAATRATRASATREGGLLLVAALVARLAKQLAVLLLRHALATLLDDGTHGTYLDWKLKPGLLRKTTRVADDPAQRPPSLPRPRASRHPRSSRRAGRPR